MHLCNAQDRHVYRHGLEPFLGINIHLLPGVLGLTYTYVQITSRILSHIKGMLLALLHRGQRSKPQDSRWAHACLEHMVLGSSAAAAKLTGESS